MIDVRPHRHGAIVVGRSGSWVRIELADMVQVVTWVNNSDL